MLQKKAIEKEKRKAEALAAGIDWLSDDSDNEPRVISSVMSSHDSRTNNLSDNVINAFCIMYGMFPESEQRTSLM